MELAGTIRVYDGENKYALKEEKTYHYIRAGRQYYSQLSYLQIFCNGEILLQLDTVNKVVSVIRQQPGAATKATGPHRPAFQRHGAVQDCGLRIGGRRAADTAPA